MAWWRSNAPWPGRPGIVTLGQSQRGGCSYLFRRSGPACVSRGSSGGGLGGDVTRTAYVLPRLRSRLRYAAGYVAPCGVRLGLAVRTAYRFLLGALQGFSAGSPLGFLEDARRVLRVYVYAHIRLIDHMLEWI